MKPIGPDEHGKASAPRTFPTPDSPEAIMALADGYQRSRVLLTAFELGVFGELDREPRAPDEVARRLDCDARAMDRLLRALVTLGLLTLEQGRFACTPAAARFLSRQSPDCLTSLDHTENLYHAWGTLTGAVRAGTAQKTGLGSESFDYEAFIEAMDRRARGDADALAEAIGLAGVTRVLDVGGGSGAYSMAMARAEPSLTAVVLDLPEVTPLTMRYVDKAGFTGRVVTRAGDYHTDVLVDQNGHGFDLVLLSAIVHINSSEENVSLLRRCHAALAPGGRVAMVDFVMDEERLRPPFGALFALNMLLNTARGDTYTASEIADWLVRAGFSPLPPKAFGPTTSLVMGRKD